MKVLVVGAGVMSHGIAEICALAGYEVLLVDISEDALKNALSRITWSVKKLEQKGRVKNADEIISRIKTTTDLVSAAKQISLLRLLLRRRKLRRRFSVRLMRTAGEM